MNTTKLNRVKVKIERANLILKGKALKYLIKAYKKVGIFDSYKRLLPLTKKQYEITTLLYLNYRYNQ